MESNLSSTDKQGIVSSFLEIAVGQSADTATRFLQATSWNIEEAIQLFYVENESGPVASSAYSQPIEDVAALADQSSGLRDELQRDIRNDHDVRQEDEVRPPLPVIREALYDDAMISRVSTIGYPIRGPSSVVAFRNFDEEMRRPGVWETDQGATSTTNSSRDNLASLYRPPFDLMHHGPFEQAKVAASVQDKWFLVNLQSTKEFSSHTLNRDIWANEAVAQMVKTNFIFWQVYDDTSEGRKVCTYYKLDSFPAVLIIDPITGQKMHSWSRMIQPDRFLEDLLPFLDAGPKDHHVSLSHKRPRESSMTPSHKIQVTAADETYEEDEEVQRALAASLEPMENSSGISSKDENVTNSDKKEEMALPKKPTYPPLPEEPKGDKNLLCRVGVRLPDGRRVQRTFFRTDPVQLLWSFCSSILEEAETRSFRLTQAIPGASKCLDYSSNLTFDESGLSNSMISVTWE